ncbi:tubulin-tyrosine ligase/Tubulin polyglutamylase, partial [Ochromonadaceae sp. CCMP2298]
EHFRSIQPWQTINHFPGMPNIARKNRMGQNLNKMLKMFPREYGFYPRTWILPAEMADFRNQFDGNGNTLNSKVYIIKPDAGCQGRGIYLTK